VNPYAQDTATHFRLIFQVSAPLSCQKSVDLVVFSR
jgi:hypothetical protein